MRATGFLAVAVGLVGCTDETCYSMMQDGKDVGRMYVVSKSAIVQKVRWMLSTKGDRYDFGKGVTFTKQGDLSTCSPLKWTDKQPGDDTSRTCYGTNQKPAACLTGTSASVACFVEGVPRSSDNLASCNSWPSSLPPPLTGPSATCPSGTTVGILGVDEFPPFDAEGRQGDKGFRCSTTVGRCADAFWAVAPASESAAYAREYTCERFWGNALPVATASVQFGPATAFSGTHAPASGKMSDAIALGKDYASGNVVDLRLTYLTPCACQTLPPPPP